MFRNDNVRGAWCVVLSVLALGCSRDHRTPLVVYSPHGRDLLTLFELRFEALHPDIDVRWLDMGSQDVYRSEEHTSELQSRPHLVCRLLLEKKKKNNKNDNDLKKQKEEQK